MTCCAHNYNTCNTTYMCTGIYVPVTYVCIFNSSVVVPTTKLQLKDNLALI